MKKTLICIIFCIVCTFLNAQNKIEGKVVEVSDDGSLSPIFGANVYWEGTNIGVVSDVNGYYSINEAIFFPATLSVSYVGYTVEDNLFIDNKYIFYLKPSVELDEVQVEAIKNTSNISLIEPVNIQTLSTGEIQKAACCNLSECFETNNSIDVSYSDAITGIKKIQMLGVDGNYTQITSELIPLIRGIQRSYGLTYIPGSWIESIQIIKGSGSVVNGYEALTGEINIEYFKPEDSTDKIKWNVYINKSGKLENNLILTSKKGDWRSNLFTHVSYFDREIDNHGYHNNSEYKGDGFLDMPKLKQFSFLNRWQYYGSEKYNFQINVRGTLDDRIAGQITNNQIIDTPYISNINNQLIQVYAKAGKIIDSNRSIGSQTSITLHNQNAKLGNNIYEGKNESFSMNLVYQNQINTKSLFKYGSSYFADRYHESFNGNIINAINLRKRVDLVTGLFSEYTYVNEKFSIVSGFRADYYNIQEKVYYSPRLNVKYNANDRIAIRFSAGKAFRISNVFADNMQYFSSSRQVVVGDSLQPEIGWNTGLNFSYCFNFLNNEGSLNIDLYRTIFENQITVDIENKDKVVFGNLNGNSFANVMQIDLVYNLVKNFNIRLSYKKSKSISTFNGVQKLVPLTPKERGLVNFSYIALAEKLNLDFTVNYVGKSRIPDNIVSADNFSTPFCLFNSQITYKLSNADIYIGLENITDYTQPNPIIDSDTPFGPNFDASLIWGPVMGRHFYLGLRIALK